MSVDPSWWDLLDVSDGARVARHTPHTHTAGVLTKLDTANAGWWSEDAW